MNVDASIFKAYDIRGIYGKNLFDETAEAIGRAFSSILQPEKVVVGRDIRLSSPILHKFLLKGLVESGVDVIDIGIVSTDMFYFACAEKNSPGIMITASHNPKEYNGFKMVKSIPYLLSGEEGIHDIRKVIENEKFSKVKDKTGKIDYLDVSKKFIERILSLVPHKNFKKMKIVVDTANGSVGPIFRKLFSNIPQLEIIELYFESDGNFPNHGGDPLQEGNRLDLEKAVVKMKADLGFAFDTDGDRFFCIDRKGEFIAGDFMTALLASYFLKRYKGAAIIYDIRASLAIKDTIEKLGGRAIYNRVGHAYIKKRMLEENAIFAGEITGHYYFKDFYGCDSGLVPVMYLLDLLSNSELLLDDIITEYKERYFISGEINSTVKNLDSVLEKIKDNYLIKAEKVITIDGITIENNKWRFNVRASNTEPLLRLNLEANSRELMEEKRDELLKLIRS